jgi:hypothetical protein
MPKKGMTAAEFRKQLAEDPVYQQGRREALARNREIQRISQHEEDQVISEIRSLGGKGRSFEDLQRPSAENEIARSVIERHLLNGYIYRTLFQMLDILQGWGPHSTSWVAVRSLLRAREAELIADNGVVIGDVMASLGNLATEAVLPDLLNVLADRKFGIHRNSILHDSTTLRLSRPALELAENFQPDEEIAVGYAKALKKWRKNSAKKQSVNAGEKELNGYQLFQKRHNDPRPSQTPGGEIVRLLKLRVKRWFSRS